MFFFTFALLEYGVSSNHKSQYYDCRQNKFYQLLLRLFLFSLWSYLLFPKYDLTQ